MPVLLALGAFLLFGLVFGPQWWVRRAMEQHAADRPDLPGTGGEFACHLLARHAQRTRHLARAHARTSLALGGLPAARLLAHLAMPTSATTLLRAIQGLPLPDPDPPRIVGVDDWALRKGRTYGTIVVDLERRRSGDVNVGLRQEIDTSQASERGTSDDQLGPLECLTLQ